MDPNEKSNENRRTERDLDAAEKATIAVSIVAMILLFAWYIFG